jgi:MoxR-like ATPase
MTSREKIQAVVTEINKVVVGQERLINRLLIGLFSGGHVLLEGVPGLAKTLTINTLAKVLDLHFHRIQFTPDLLPSDLVGTMIYNPQTTEFDVKKGPIFAQIILADEINRAPAKVQSALLEAMAERQVTIGDTTYHLEKPFLVLATQNPVEQEGTFPLPEAQVDRFMMKVYLDYLTKEQELEVMRRMADINYVSETNTVMTLQDIFAIQKEINQITISETLEKYIIELIFATRKPADYGLTQEANYVQFGASPRATIQLNLAAKVMAYLEGRDYVLPEDIKEVAPDVLNHRILLTYEAEAENVSTLDIIQTILNSVAINR